MSATPPSQPPLYDLLTELDRLEEIREDLEELGLRTLEEVDARIEELNQLIDDLSGEEK
jgi:L-lactate utilization protein LutB